MQWKFWHKVKDNFNKNSIIHLRMPRNDTCYDEAAFPAYFFYVSTCFVGKMVFCKMRFKDLHVIVLTKIRQRWF